MHLPQLLTALLPLVISPTTSTPLPLPTDPSPLFLTSFYSGIHCTGLRTGNFTGPNNLPNQQTNPEIPATYKTCLPIPYPGITSAAMFQSVNRDNNTYASGNSSGSQYVFRLHADADCRDHTQRGEEERWGGGRVGNATRYCVRTGTVPGAVAWSVRVRGYWG
ncbi:hypothetical protein CBER1_11281 [Cercospora berteroae]|uniref:Uncharacterized protein n=1 Tax=Cercospora berteroae TaxID=357750 RepID=A0A2S6BZ84_9PEZI|nr:hypothetical protein CBER1_11281 [Cercospora berteroae]